MSDRLPYEDQLPHHLRDFPLPDENAAWADMKRRLDEDDDRGAIVWWRKGCALWAGIALLTALLITGWWYFNREKTSHASSAENEKLRVKEPQTNSEDSLNKKSLTLQPDHLPISPDNDSLTQPSSIPPADTITSARKQAASLRKSQQAQTASVATNRDKKTSEEISEEPSSKKTGISKPETSVQVKRRPTQTQQPSPVTSPATKASSNNPAQPLKHLPVDSIKQYVAETTPVQPAHPATISQDKFPIDSIKAFVARDTTTQVRYDSSLTSQKSWPIDSIKAFVTGDTVTRNTSELLASQTDSLSAKDSSLAKSDTTKNELFLSAGLALTQQIPFAGQKAVPYGSQGREFSIADYIPSVYFRLNKKHRWFIQGEFRYGAPQYSKPITYSIQEDTNSTAPIARSEKTLQKTYYHQLPISFNYYITRDWAVGAGIVWNRFSKSIFEENTLQRDPLNPVDTFLVKETMVGKNPATEGLSRSYFQGLIESQYQWKRFSFGGRYTFGLSPYLRFTLPGEAERRERNQSLQFFIRYNLWAKSLKE